VSLYAGRLKHFLSRWKTITDDQFVLQVVKGYKIPFLKIPIQDALPPAKTFYNCERQFLVTEISRMLAMGVLNSVLVVEDQYVSPIFAVAKPNGSRRLILNLKHLNTFIDCPHFKMEDYRTVLNMIQWKNYMAVLDLKDAYYLIAIDEYHRKYLRFIFEDKPYEYSSLPFGLCTAPLMFTNF